MYIVVRYFQASCREGVLIKSEKLSCCDYICFDARGHFFRPNNKI